MPSIEDNRACWDVQYDWPEHGDEWSAWWGHPAAQWRWSLLPRIQSFLPAKTILEIGPGFGRWTNYLRDHCDRLIIVDLSDACIQACQERFATCGHIEYHTTDGKSLPMVPDHSVDFVFSFDSLVHAEADVISAYIDAIAARLGVDGVAFLHHSNAGSYHRYFTVMDRVPRGRAVLERFPFVDTSDRWRARTVTAELVRRHARAAGLECIGQELVNWGTWRLIDTLSLLTPVGSKWTRATKTVRNREFMKEAAHVRALSGLYLTAGDREPVPSPGHAIRS